MGDDSPINPNDIQAKNKFINEAGLFELIGKSDKDKAQDLDRKSVV